MRSNFRFRRRSGILSNLIGIVVTLFFTAVCIFFAFMKIVYAPKYTDEIVCQYENDKIVKIEFDSDFSHYSYGLEDNIDLSYSKRYRFDKPTKVVVKTDGDKDNPHMTIYLKNTRRRY